MEPVGGSTRIRVDARVLAATNKDLPAEIRAGRFREDLYFRLNVVPIFVPPLRERQEDIPLLAQHFMAMLAKEYGRRPKTFDRDAMAALERYPWPGNVRELRNLVERLMIMVPGDRVDGRDVSFLDVGGGVAVADTAARPAPPLGSLHDARDQFERDYILRALAAQQGNISRTAEMLGIERSNLYRKMRGFGIAPPRSESEPVDR
jgi:two-component system nitrogen regulation response regulator NtrX